MPCGRLLPVLLLPLLPACTPKDRPDSGGEDTSPYVYRDTEAVEDTAPPVETADSVPPTETAETGDTGEVVDPATIAALDLYPAGLVVGPGGTFPLRVVVTTLGGEVRDAAPEEVSFRSEDEAVATVDAGGAVTAVAVGSGRLVVACGGLEAEVALEVTEATTVRLQVVDAATGNPLPGAWGNVDGGSRVAGDGAGLVEIEAGDGLHQVSAWADGYVAVTVMDTPARELVLPLRPLSATGVDLQGPVDFSGVDPGAYTDVVVGLASATLPDHPLFFQVEDLVGPDRTVSIWGVDVDLPANLFVRSYVEDYQARATAGAFGAWSLAGPVPIAEVTAALDGERDLLEILNDHLGSFSWGYVDGLSGVDGDALVAAQAPATALTDVVQVEVPPLSLGFSGDEEPLVLVTEENADGGHALAGMGLGTGTTLALRIPEGAVLPGGTSWALAVAQVDGFGSGYGMALVASPVALGVAALPEFQAVPTIDRFSGSTREFALSSDARAHLVRVTIEGGGEADVRDVYLRGGACDGIIPRLGTTFGWGRTTWTLAAAETSHDTFEGLTATGRFHEPDLAPLVLTAAQVGHTFTGE